MAFIALATDKPQHSHDCERCKFCGSYTALDARENRDVYVCGGEGVVVRYSSDGPDYAAWPRPIFEILVDGDPEVAFIGELLR